MPPRGPRTRTPPPALDAAALDRLALRYVERFATTRGKLADYLRRKIRERGWEGDPVDPAAVAERMAGLGYIDDRFYAENKAMSLTRRGFGASRVADALRQARVDDADAVPARTIAAEGEGASALAFARRKRIGPFATEPADPARRQKQIAAMVRAGHGFAVARRIVEAGPGDVPEFNDAVTLEHCDEGDPW